MKWPLVTRRSYDDLNTRYQQALDATAKARDERNAFRTAAATSARQFAEADATNRRLEGRLLELGRRNAELAESDPEYAADLEQQLAAARAELAAEKKRGDHLQRRLDGALGLEDPAVLAGQNWQATREDGPRKGVAS